MGDTKIHTNWQSPRLWGLEKRVSLQAEGMVQSCVVSVDEKYEDLKRVFFSHGLGVLSLENQLGKLFPLQSTMWRFDFYSIDTTLIQSRVLPAF